MYKGLSGFIKKVPIQMIRYKLAGVRLLKRTNQKIKSCVKGLTLNFGMFRIKLKQFSLILSRLLVFYSAHFFQPKANSRCQEKEKKIRQQKNVDTNLSCRI